jgi:2-methylisocitrate lyase-like PEP mutase family enzyme
MSYRTEAFRKLHQQTSVLCLPNAWDAVSARIIERAGARAIGTTSAGISWSLGYPDGGAVPVAQMLGAIARIVRVANVPVSVDVEHGYSDNPAVVASNILRLVDLGVAGVNLEDGGDSPELLLRKIEAVRNALARTGSDLFINARTDVYWGELVGESLRVGEAIRRGQSYAHAGADGLFVPGVHRADDIRTICDEVAVPVNVLAWHGLPDAQALAGLGAARLSAGSTIARTAMGKVEQIVTDFLSVGRSDSIAEGALFYPEVQELFDIRADVESLPTASLPLT